MPISIPLERQLIALLIRDPKFASSILEILSEDTFSHPQHKFIVRLLKEHFTKFKNMPSLEAFLDTTLTENPSLTQEEKKILGSILLEVFGDLNIPDELYIKDKVNHIVQSAALRNAIATAGILLEEGKVEEIYSTLEKTKNLLSLNQKGPIDFVETFEASLNGLIEFEKAKKIPTGFQNLDNLVRGVGCGELAIVIAATNVGKSIYLSNLAINAIKTGHRTLLVSLELSELDTFARLAASLLSLPTNELIDSKEEAMKRKELLLQTFKGNFFISAYPTKGLTLSQLNGIIKQFEMLHGKLDLLVLDAAENLRTRGNDLRAETVDLYQRLRGLAGENQIAIWTCSQANRIGMQAYRVRDIHAAESIDKIFTADLVISISQTEEEYPHRARLFLVKSRKSRKFVEIPLLIDYTTARILEQPGFVLQGEMSAEQISQVRLNIGIPPEELIV